MAKYELQWKNGLIICNILGLNVSYVEGYQISKEAENNSNNCVNQEKELPMTKTFSALCIPFQFVFHMMLRTLFNVTVFNLEL